ncbi:hypothetical protein RI054_06g35430 [Pseudoscourfieldia marina]
MSANTTTSTQGKVASAARGDSPSSVLALSSAASTPSSAWGSSLLGWLTDVVGLGTPSNAQTQARYQAHAQSYSNTSTPRRPAPPSLAVPPPPVILHPHPPRPGARDDACLPSPTGDGNIRPQGKPGHRRSATEGAEALGLMMEIQLDDRALIASLKEQLEAACSAAANAEHRCADAVLRADLAKAAAEKERYRRVKSEKSLEQLQSMLESSSRREMRLAKEREQLMQDSMMLGAASTRLVEAEATLRRGAEKRDRLERENAILRSVLRGEDVHTALSAFERGEEDALHGGATTSAKAQGDVRSSEEAHPTCLPSWRAAAPAPAALSKVASAPVLTYLQGADPLAAKLNGLRKLKAPSATGDDA